jgi:hypothetical protein
MNNGVLRFVTPCEVEGNGTQHSDTRQEMSHSIKSVGMPEGQKIKRINGKGLPQERDCFRHFFFANGF